MEILRLAGAYCNILFYHNCRDLYSFNWHGSWMGGEWRMPTEGNFWLGTDYNLLKQVCKFITMLGRSRFFKELLGLGLTFFMTICRFQIYFHFSKDSTCGFLGHVKYPKISIPQVNDSRFYTIHRFQDQGRASFTLSSTLLFSCS